MMKELLNMYCDFCNPSNLTLERVHTSLDIVQYKCSSCGNYKVLDSDTKNKATNEDFLIDNDILDDNRPR